MEYLYITNRNGIRKPKSLDIKILHIRKINIRGVLNLPPRKLTISAARGSQTVGENTRTMCDTSGPHMGPPNNFFFNNLPTFVRIYFYDKHCDRPIMGVEGAPHLKVTGWPTTHIVPLVSYKLLVEDTQSRESALRLRVR
jgi:hypothetical protein